MKTIKYLLKRIIDIYQSIRTYDLQINKITKENDEVSELIVEPIICKGSRATTSLSEKERQELVERISAMSDAELRLIVDEAIPTEMCLEKIQNELNKARAFANSVTNAMTLLQSYNERR